MSYIKLHLPACMQGDSASSHSTIASCYSSLCGRKRLVTVRKRGLQLKCPSLSVPSISASLPTKVAPKLILVLIFHLCFQVDQAQMGVATFLRLISSYQGIFHGHYWISSAKLKCLTGLHIGWQPSLVFSWNLFSLSNISLLLLAEHIIICS